MPRYYYRRRWKPRWRKRYRRFWSWGVRAPFRRRRRHKRRVRRKLKLLPLKQWQPSHIRKLFIKGLFCLFQVHKVRYNHDYNQYETSVPREGLPNGGGFTIVRFNLLSLFEQHEKARNVWSISNKNFPFFRYTGAIVKIYRPLSVDVVVKFQTCYPMNSTKLMFTGSQPSIMMMSKGTKRIKCQKNAPNAKPYKKFRIPPPQNMTNKWFFQHDHAQTGLLLIQASSASFDQYYSSEQSESSTITLHTLNTKIFQNLNFANTPTYGYIPKNGFALYATNGATEPEVGDLIWLGQTKLYNKGQQIKEAQGNTFKDKLTYYMSHPEMWGNPFHSDHLHQQNPLWFATAQPTIQLSGTTDINVKIKTKGFNQVTQELFFDIRYNPFKDKGYNNNIYIKANWKDNNHDLEPEPDIDLQNPGFPNWLSGFGFIDYLIKLGTKSQITTHYILLHKSTYFDPQLPFYLFIDKWFIDGNSEDLLGRTGWDNTNWYPMITHQEQAMDLLALAGPGAPKLGNTKLAECKMEYTFCFKIGGCAPPVEKVADPTKQPSFAVPANILDTNSLQSPEQSIESFLYQFDWRRDQITERAAQRITKDFSTPQSLFTDAGTTGTQVPILKTQEKEQLSSEEEEAQTETLFEQLQLQRNKQKQLRLRIRQLIHQIQALE
nr:MAG: ORF1 [TTV-like mini virus]